MIYFNSENLCFRKVYEVSMEKRQKQFTALLIYGIIWIVKLILIIIFPYIIRTVLSLPYDSIAFSIASVIFFFLLFTQFIFPILSIVFGVKNKNRIGIILGIIENMLSIVITTYIFSGGFAFF